MNSTGKVAIVTGAGSGIGRSVALAFLKDGYRVALAGRRKDRLDQTAKDSGAGERALVVQTDVTDPKSVQALFAATKEKFARLDVLFNNAGIGTPGGIMLEDLTLEQWQAVVNTNLTGMFLCTQEAFRIMKGQTPRGGRIINNGSISAHAARPDLAARMAKGVPQANGQIAVEPLMEVEQVGAAVLHMANLPLETNVQFMTIMATKMPFIGRG